MRQAPQTVLTDGSPSLGLWGIAWQRLRRERTAVAGLLVLVALAVIAAVAPVVAPHNPVRSDVATAGPYRLAAWQFDPDPAKSGRWDYPLGTDALGRDVLSRLLFGARVSLVVGTIPTAVILLLGVPLGLAAGYVGGRTDRLTMRLTDLAYAFPAILFFVVLQSALRETRVGDWWNGLALLFVTLSVLSWPGIARLVRGETMTLKQQAFVEAARATGAGAGWIVRRHVLPNVLGPIIVTTAFIVPGTIMAEATLGFLGLGLRPSADLAAPFPTSWGQMVLEGSRDWWRQPWLLAAPCLAIAVTTLAVTLVSEGLRRALNPRGR
jgi:oligopeptide transport system permease protein